MSVRIHDRAPAIDPLRYGGVVRDVPRSIHTRPIDELMMVKWRYKRPRAQTSERRSLTVIDRGDRFETASDDFRFAAAVAAFGQLLRGEGAAMDLGYGQVAAIAEEAIGHDDDDRAELLQLVRSAQHLRY